MAMSHVSFHTETKHELFCAIPAGKAFAVPQYKDYIRSVKASTSLTAGPHLRLVVNLSQYDLRINKSA